MTTVTPTSWNEDIDLQCQLDLLGEDEDKRKALALLWSEFKEPLIVFVENKVRFISGASAADAVQLTFIALWEKVSNGTFNPEGSLRSLLFTMARNKAIDLRRAGSHYTTLDEEFLTKTHENLNETKVGEAWKRAQQIGVVNEIFQRVPSLRAISFP